MKKPIAKKLARLVIKKDKLVKELLDACTSLQEEWRAQHLEMERLKTHCVEHPEDKTAKRALKRKIFTTTRASREYTTACAYLRNIRDVDAMRLPDDVLDQLTLMSGIPLSEITEQA